MARSQNVPDGGAALAPSEAGTFPAEQKLRESLSTAAGRFLLLSFLGSECFPKSLTKGGKGQRLKSPTFLSACEHEVGVRAGARAGHPHPCLKGVRLRPAGGRATQGPERWAVVAPGGPEGRAGGSSAFRYVGRPDHGMRLYFHIVTVC